MKTHEMIVCGGPCKAYFEPDSDIQAFCDSCGEKDPISAHFASWLKYAGQLTPEQVSQPLQGVDAQWDPMNHEEEQWFYKQPESATDQ